MDELRVTVVNFGDRKYLQLQCRDPVTGKKKTKSARTDDPVKAERAAAKLEAELREGRYKPPSKTTWSEFRQRYEDEWLMSLSGGSDEKSGTVLDLVESHLSPRLLSEMTSDSVSRFQAWLRKRGSREATIKSYLAHLLAALRWAKRVGLLTEVPIVEMPRRAKNSKMMKGRPVTTEEFERMLDKTPTVVGQELATHWQYYLNGLWRSGLRLGESLELYWDRDDKLAIDLSGKNPMLRIRAELEKGNQERLLPMAPEFAEFLLETAEQDRTGRVFKLQSKTLDQENLSRNRVGIIVSEIGKAANVKVHTYSKSEQVKYASAHDLRRSFGERWSVRVMPQVLKELMRHEDISTTMRYYVGRNAQLTAQILWDEHLKKNPSNTSGNSQPISSPSEGEEIRRN